MFAHNIAFVLILAAPLAAISPVAAQYPDGHPPVPLVKEGTTIKISTHVYVIPDELVPVVPNVGIVVGRKATLVIDPGMGFRNGQAVLREVAKVSRNTELYLVNTHFHPEHTTGEMAFPADTKIVRAAAQQQDVEELGMQWVKRFSKRSPEFHALLDGVSFRAPTEVFEREKTLDLGGVRVRLIRLGPGHTRGDTVFFVEQDRVLFSGDLAMKELFPAFATPQSSVRTWLTSLDEMDRLQARTLVPAHGELADPSIIGAYREYLSALQARVAELKREGKTADDTAVALRVEFKEKYPKWRQPLRVHNAASRVYAEVP